MLVYDVKYHYAPMQYKKFIIVQVFFFARSKNHIFYTNLIPVWSIR